MNKLQEERHKYATGKISKQEFIMTMSKYHYCLFEYSEFIKEGIISEIIIRDDNVVATSRRNQIKMYCDQYDTRGIPLEMLNFGAFENKEILGVFQIIAQYLPNDFIAYDIGGNIGWFALELGKQFPESTIHSFEPIPETFQKMKANIALNELTNIYPHNYGFSNEEKELTFFYDRNMTGGTSLVNIMDKGSIDEVRCQVKTLDNVTRALSSRIDFIKCDVEGAELLVFKGGMKTIREQKPILYSEMLRKWAAKFNYHPNDIIYLLRDVGYKCFSFSEDMGKVLVEKVTDETKETNYIFLHTEKHLMK